MGLMSRPIPLPRLFPFFLLKVEPLPTERLWLLDRDRTLRLRLGAPVGAPLLTSPALRA